MSALALETKAFMVETRTAGIFVLVLIELDWGWMEYSRVQGSGVYNFRNSSDSRCKEVVEFICHCGFVINVAAIDQNWVNYLNHFWFWSHVLLGFLHDFWGWFQNRTFTAAKYTVTVYRLQ